MNSRHSVTVEVEDIGATARALADIGSPWARVMSLTFPLAPPRLVRS